MPFACPGCSAPIEASPERRRLRCRACGERIRARAAGATDGQRLYDVELAGRPATRRRVQVDWSGEDALRLRRWLFWSSLLTLGLIVVLFALARFAR